MIKKVELQNFKSIGTSTIDIKPQGLSLLVGGNNSGKSTLLHALATWEFCKTVLIFEKSPKALLSTDTRAGYGITLDDFTPINISSFKCLWTNFTSSQSYNLIIKCYWDDNNGTEKYLSIGLALNQERLFIKKIDSNIAEGDTVPRIAYLPTFAGITSKEQWMTPAYRSKLIGQGLAGGVLRNIIMDLFLENQKIREKKKGTKKKLSASDLQYIRDNDPYEILNSVLARIFHGILSPKKFNPEFHTHVVVEYTKGHWEDDKFKVSDKNKGDIMVEGSGFLQWLSVYTFALSPKIDVLLLDEPDAHLHNSLQNILIENLLQISSKNNKQVLVATHSSEVIKDFDYQRILQLNKPHYRYLSSDSKKTPLLSGLGTEYFPLFESVQKHKKIIFVENPSDIQFLSAWANKFTNWPKNIVVWPKANKQKERKQVFLYLKDVINDIKCISLSDRDTCSYKETLKSLKCKGCNDISDANGAEMRYRTWRRMEIESYLFCPEAIARLLTRKTPGSVYDDKLTAVNTYLNNHGIILNGDRSISDKTDLNFTLFDLDPKELFEPLCTHFGINKFEIANEMQEAEIFDDVKTFINEVVAFAHL